MGRAGGFSANFSPETLEAFRSLCKEQGKQYTKVLEQMAEIYIQHGGNVEVLMTTGATGSSSQVSTMKLIQRLERLEENEEFNAETFHSIQDLEKRLSALEGKRKTGSKK